MSNSVADDFEQRLAAFEQQWRTERVPMLRDFVDESVTAPVALMIELVLVDLEYRWQRGSTNREIVDQLGTTPRLEDYARVYSGVLTLSDFLAPAIAEEYRVRRLWGDRPNHDHYVSRFPELRDSMLPLLTRIDAELLADATGVTPPSTQTRPTVIAVNSRAPLAWTDYVLQVHLGSGGVGKVFRAWQKSLERHVAIKSLRKRLLASPHAVERFLQEGRLLARLQHANVVRVHGLGRYPGGGYFLAMDYLDAENLADRVAQALPSISESISIALAVAHAMQHAHQHGVIHCDLKPSNVLVNSVNEVFVVDFGFAQLLAPGRTQGIHGVGGTPAFMAPEQLERTLGDVSPATDVYGIGAVLLFLLTRRTPAELSNSADDLLNGWTISLSQHEDRWGRAIPQALARLCLKCLRHRPADRYATMAELADELKRVRAMAC